MLSRQEGLTKTYNRFHDPDESAADIQKLRDLHVEMDQAVAAAYGWSDLDLGHGFHETKQGIRYTISEPARREVLARLLKLNHERYAEEVKQGAPRQEGETSVRSGSRNPGSPRRRPTPAAVATTLFDMTGVDTAFPSHGSRQAAVRPALRSGRRPAGIAIDRLPRRPGDRPSSEGPTVFSSATTGRSSPPLADKLFTTKDQTDGFDPVGGFARTARPARRGPQGRGDILERGSRFDEVAKGVSGLRPEADPTDPQGGGEAAGVPKSRQGGLRRTARKCCRSSTRTG